MPRVHDFEQYMAWCDCAETGLPFEYGGATQCGRLNDHNNNQDSIAMVSGKDSVVGVVCDGCATAEHSYSSNEVGSRLLSVLIANLTTNLVLEHGVASLQRELPGLEKVMCERMLAVTELLVPAEVGDRFLKSFLMSTSVVFAVDKTDFMVFGCGDGLLAVNGEFVSLENQGGEYLARQLTGSKNWAAKLDGGSASFRVWREGAADDLHSLMLGTDGFAQICERYRDMMVAFAGGSDESSVRPGYNALLSAEFRRRIWYKEAVQQWAASQDAHDDRSFLLLRRVRSENGDARKCSKSRTRKLRGRADSSVH